MSAEVLTGPENAVFELVAKGRSDHRILEEAGLSQAAFNDVLKKLFGKMGVSSRVELILFAHSEPTRSTKGKTRKSVVHSDGTAQTATLSDATAGKLKATGERAA